MIALNNLIKTTSRSKKRIGRGYGSGKGGHTVGRGTKGQKARGDINPIFVGSKLRKSLVKRLPFLRGKGKLKSRQNKPIVINLKDLASLPAGTTVDAKKLISLGLIKVTDAKKTIKVLGNSELKVALTVLTESSKGAKAIIEKAGGSVGKLTEKKSEIITDKPVKIVKVVKAIKLAPKKTTQKK